MAHFALIITKSQGGIGRHPQRRIPGQMVREEFEDYSFASPWERFSGAIEEVLRGWCTEEGSGEGTEEKDVAIAVELKHKLPFRREPYFLKLHVGGPEGHHQPDSPKVNDQIEPETAGAPSAERMPGSGDFPLTNMPEALQEQSHSDVDDDQGSGEEEEEEYNDDEEEEEEEEEGVVERKSIIKFESIKMPHIGAQVYMDSSKYFQGSLHKIQRWFGVEQYAILHPASHTGRILDPQEAATVLSAVSIALANVGSQLPVFIPVHNELRDGARGVAIVNGRTVHFEADNSQSSQRPDHLRCVSGQLHVLSHHVEGYSPKASMLCSALAAPDKKDAAQKMASEEQNGFRVAVSVCVAYKIPVPVLRDVKMRSMVDSEMDAEDIAAVWKDVWDEGCVWQPWASEVDPVNGLEVDIIWRDAPITVEEPYPNLTVRGAQEWRIHALSAERSMNVSWSIFSSARSSARQHLRLTVLADFLSGEDWAPGLSANRLTLYVRLHNLLEGLDVVQEARTVGDLLSEDFWSLQSSSFPDIPPEDVLMHSIKDMFGDRADLEPGFMTEHVTYKDPPAMMTSSPLFFLAPFRSLFCRLALHAIVYRNPRAVSWLWTHFIHAIRVHHWEPLQRLPLMDLVGYQPRQSESEPEWPDLSACLIHQKLQLINLCIHRQHVLKKGGIISSAISRLPERVSWTGTGSTISEYESCENEWEPMEPGSSRKDSTDLTEAIDSTPDSKEEAEEKSVTRIGKSKEDEVPCGVASVMDGCKLLHRDKDICIPITQQVPVYTSDTLAHHQSVLSALEDSPGGHERALKMQAQVLISDMAAFKAANPGAVLEDFVRWHSPKDWIADDKGGGQLSNRMARVNNRWECYWKEVAPCPASRQEPLMDPLIEGERAMHYLETIPPMDLFEQLIHVGFFGALSCLQHAPSVSLPPIYESLEQFHKYLATWDPSEISLSDRMDILQGFDILERIVVLGEGLSRRLEGCPNAVQSILELILSSKANTEGVADVRDGVRVVDEEKNSLMDLLSRGKSAEGETSKSWGSALEHEWVVRCRNESEGKGGQQHRIYVKDAVGELRVATIVTSGS